MGDDGKRDGVFLPRRAQRFIEGCARYTYEPPQRQAILRYIRHCVIRPAIYADRDLRVTQIDRCHRALGRFSFRAIVWPLDCPAPGLS